MASAAAKLKAFLAGETFRTPEVPVYSNVTGEKHGDPNAIRDAMVAQVTSSVHWIDTVNAMTRDRIDHFTEFGPGQTLSGLVKKTAPTAITSSVSDIITLEAAATLL